MESASGNPLNLDQRSFETLKWSAIWYAVARGIESVAAQISPRFMGGFAGELANTYGVSYHFGFSFQALIGDIIWGAIYGAIIGLVLSKLYDKIVGWNRQYLKGKLSTFFKLLFYPALFGSILGFFSLFAALGSVTGIMPFLIVIGGAILANYLYAAMMTKHVGAMYGPTV